MGAEEELGFLKGFGSIHVKGLNPEEFCLPLVIKSPKTLQQFTIF